MKKICILGILLIFFSYSTAQYPVVRFNYKYGFISPHHKSFKYFITGHVKAYDIKIGFQTYGKKHWQQLYKYPVQGIGFYHGNLGNPEILGDVNSVYYFITFPLLQIKNTTIYFNNSLGFSYLKKIYDPRNNILNFAIASNINVHFALDFEGNIKITDKISARLGLNVTHFSNGRIKEPNKGLNLITSFFGLRYTPKIPQYITEPYKLTKFEAFHYYKVTLSGGVIDLYGDPQDKRFIGIDLNVRRNKLFSEKLSWGYGFDFIYDTSNRKKLNIQADSKANFSDLLLCGGFITLGIHFYRVTLNFDQLVYLYHKTDKYQYVYHRLGFNFNITDNLFLNLSLKTYFAKAELLEWGVGVRLK